MYPAVKINESIFQSGFILLPSHTIDSRRSLALESVKAVAEEADVEMVKQSSEPFLLPFPCCLSHTVQSLGHALPALCRVHVRLNDVLLRLCPSLHKLREGFSFLVRLLHRYYSTVRLLHHLRVRRSVMAFADRPCSSNQGVLEISRFSCMLFLSVRGFSDYAGPNSHSGLAWLPYCLFPYRNEVGILIHRLFAAQ